MLRIATLLVATATLQAAEQLPRTPISGSPATPNSAVFSFIDTTLHALLAIESLSPETITAHQKSLSEELTVLKKAYARTKTNADRSHKARIETAIATVSQGLELIEKLPLTKTTISSPFIDERKNRFEGLKKCLKKRLELPDRPDSCPAVDPERGSPTKFLRQRSGTASSLQE